MSCNEANAQWRIWASSDGGEQEEFITSGLWRLAENAKGDQPDGITLVAAAVEDWTHYARPSDEGSVGPPMDDINDAASSDGGGDNDGGGSRKTPAVTPAARGGSDGGVCTRGSSKKMRVALL